MKAIYKEFIKMHFERDSALSLKLQHNKDQQSNYASQLLLKIFPGASQWS